MTGLTTRQAAVLAFINEYRKSRGYPPTLREIGARFGIRSTNDLLALERKGAICRQDMKSLGITVLGGVAVLDESAASEIRDARVEIQRLRGLMRKLYSASRERIAWRLDQVASEISAEFAASGEPL